MDGKEDETSETTRTTFDGSAEKTQRTLLEMIKNPDDHVAWTKFYKRYHSFIRGVASNYARRHSLPLTADDIEDLVVRVMTEISRKAGDFVYDPNKGLFRSHLATVTCRRCIDLFRKKLIRPDMDQPASREEADEERGTAIVDRITSDDTGDFSRMIEEHDMQIGRALALEKLRSGKNLSARQFQIFEKLAMGVPPADVCAQLGVSTTQIYNARCLAMPFYEKALREAKAELDEPKALPPAPGEPPPSCAAVVAR